MAVLEPIVLTDMERSELERRTRARSTPARQRIRARVILLAAQGLSNRAISRTVGMRYEHVGTWRRRFLEERLAGLDERPRPGRPALYGADARRSILDTLHQPPPSANGWTIKAITEALSNDLGISTSQVRRICLDLGITPWREMPAALPRRRRAS
jgi:transposase